MYAIYILKDELIRKEKGNPLWGGKIWADICIKLTLMLSSHHPIWSHRGLLRSSVNILEITGWGLQEYLGGELETYAWVGRAGL